MSAVPGPGTTALSSGGKDSLYAAYLAETQGWPVAEMLVFRPADEDSMMFHTPNLDLVPLQAEAWGKRVRAVPIPTGGEAGETAALTEAIRGGSGPLSVGAIASSFQWSRVLRAAGEAGRRVYAPLWRVDPIRVVREEIDAGLDIRIVQVAAEPLGEDLLGCRLDRALLCEIQRRGREVRPVHPAGEGGEYETLVVDAPFFARRIILDRTHVERRGLAHCLRVDSAHLEPKAHPASWTTNPAGDWLV